MSANELCHGQEKAAYVVSGIIPSSPPGIYSLVVLFFGRQYTLYKTWRGILQPTGSNSIKSIELHANKNSRDFGVGPSRLTLYSSV